MILRLERKRICPGDYRYLTDDGKTVLCTAGINGSVFFRSEEFSLELFTAFRNLKWEGDISSKEAARYTVGGCIDCVGDYIYDCGKKGYGLFKALNGFYFWRMPYNGFVYEAYEVGFGRKGIYLCVYKEGALVAMVSKDMRSKHFESGYTIYKEEEVPAVVLHILTVYWDFTRWSPESCSESYVLNTWQKELKNKYNPDFIEKMLSDERGNA